MPDVRRTASQRSPHDTRIVTLDAAHSSAQRPSLARLQPCRHSRGVRPLRPASAGRFSSGCSARASAHVSASLDVVASRPLICVFRLAGRPAFARPAAPASQRARLASALPSSSSDASPRHAADSLRSPLMPTLALRRRLDVLHPAARDEHRSRSLPSRVDVTLIAASCRSSRPLASPMAVACVAASQLGRSCAQPHRLEVVAQAAARSRYAASHRRRLQRLVTRSLSSPHRTAHGRRRSVRRRLARNPRRLTPACSGLATLAADARR